MTKPSTTGPSTTGTLHEPALHELALHDRHAPRPRRTSALVAATIHHGRDDVGYNRDRCCWKCQNSSRFSWPNEPSGVPVTDLLSNDHGRDAEMDDGRVRPSAAVTPPSTRIVIDTSVLIADPHCVQTFGAAALIIPLTVVEELDGLKTPSRRRRARRPHGAAVDRGPPGRARRFARRTRPDRATATVQIEINGIQQPPPHRTRTRRRRARQPHHRRRARSGRPRTTR